MAKGGKDGTMFAKLAQHMKIWAVSRHAERILALVSTLESSVFPLPTELIFLPMCLSRPDRALRYALIAGAFSVGGGVLGWLIGHYAFDLLAMPVLEFYNGVEEFEQLKAQTGTGAILLMLVTSGLAHLPPMKVVTILSGAIGFSLPLFLLAAIVARFAKFVALGLALRAWGPAIVDVIQRRLASFAIVAIVAGAGLWLASRLM
jgi:membrane protein YqaA with SNARE-associated domain